MAETPKLIAWASGLSLLAGFIHGTVMDSHFDEWWGYGLFFLLASMAQGVYGAALLFPRMLHGEPITKLWPASGRRAFYLAGIAGNASIVVLWAVTRTIGIPFLGPAAGLVEEVGIVDTISKLVEVALIVVLALLLSGARRPHREATASTGP